MAQAEYTFAQLVDDYNEFKEKYKSVKNQLSVSVKVQIKYYFTVHKNYSQNLEEYEKWIAYLPSLSSQQGGVNMRAENMQRELDALQPNVQTYMGQLKNAMLYLANICDLSNSLNSQSSEAQIHQISSYVSQILTYLHQQASGFEEAVESLASNFNNEVEESNASYAADSEGSNDVRFNPRVTRYSY